LLLFVPEIDWLNPLPLFTNTLSRSFIDSRRPTADTDITARAATRGRVFCRKENCRKSTGRRKGATPERDRDPRGSAALAIGQLSGCPAQFRHGVAAHADDADIAGLGCNYGGIRGISQRYQIALLTAEAPLLKARALLAEEQARAKQATDDWESLNRGTEPNALVLRTPQVAAARAELLAAQARLERAKLDLQRTRIYAPYDGRVQSTNSDVGQFVMAASELAKIFATDVLEARLPLDKNQLQHISLPEVRRGEALDEHDFAPTMFFVEHGGGRWQYAGRIVRTESKIDTGTRQLFVVGEIETPFDGANTSQPLLKIGQFVEAEIRARSLVDVFVIPRRLLLQDDEVLLAVDGKISRRRVSVVWRDERDAVVDDGLQDGELLITTAMGNAVAGMRVSYPGVAN